MYLYLLRCIYYENSVFVIVSTIIFFKVIVVVSIIRKKCVIVIVSIIHFLSIVPSSVYMCILINNIITR